MGSVCRHVEDRNAEHDRHLPGPGRLPDRLRVSPPNRPREGRDLPALPRVPTTDHVDAPRAETRAALRVAVGHRLGVRRAVAAVPLASPATDAVTNYAAGSWRSPAPRIPRAVSVITSPACPTAPLIADPALRAALAALTFVPASSSFCSPHTCRMRGQISRSSVLM